MASKIVRADSHQQPQQTHEKEQSGQAFCQSTLDQTLVIDMPKNSRPPQAIIIKQDQLQIGLVDFRFFP